MILNNFDFTKVLAGKVDELRSDGDIPTELASGSTAESFAIVCNSDDSMRLSLSSEVGSGKYKIYEFMSLQMRNLKTPLQKWFRILYQYMVTSLPCPVVINRLVSVVWKAPS